MIQIFTKFKNIFYEYSPCQKHKQFSCFERLIALGKKDIQKTLDHHDKKEIANFGKSNGCKGKDKLECVIGFFIEKNKDNFKGYSDIKQQINKYILKFVVVLGALGFLLAFIYLKSYDGEPLNLMSALIIFSLLPFLGTLLAAIALFYPRLKMGKVYLPNNQILPILYIVKIIKYIKSFIDKIILKSHHDEKNNHNSIFDQTQDIWNTLSTDVKKWLTFSFLNLSAASLSIGLALAFVIMPWVDDIAFAWRSQQDLSSTFFLHIAGPWSYFFPSMIPSQELITNSHYYRLGGNASEDLVQYKELLGEWWRFIFMSIVFYSIIPRLLLWRIGKEKLEYAIDKSIENISGSEKIYSIMKNGNSGFDTGEILIIDPSPSLESYEEYSEDIPISNQVLVWNLEIRDLKKVSEIEKEFDILVNKAIEVGGEHNYEEDENIVKSLSGDIKILVPSWESSVDISDLLELIESNENISSVKLFLLKKYGNRTVDTRDKEIWINRATVYDKDIQVCTSLNQGRCKAKDSDSSVDSIQNRKIKDQKNSSSSKFIKTTSIEAKNSNRDPLVTSMSHSGIKEQRRKQKIQVKPAQPSIVVTKGGSKNSSGLNMLNNETIEEKKKSKDTPKNPSKASATKDENTPIDTACSVNTQVLLWNIEISDFEKVSKIEKEFDLSFAEAIEVGGEHDYEEDENIVEGICGDVKILVPSWESSVDIIDIIELLEDSEKIGTIKLYLLQKPGSKEADDRDKDKWVKRALSFTKKKVEVVQ